MLHWRDLIFVSLERWDDVWRRNQFVCAELARRHPERTILFVTPPRDLSNAVRRREWKRLRLETRSKPAELRNVRTFTPTKIWPNSIGIGRVWNAASLRRQVAREAKQLAIRDPLLWINDQSAGHLEEEFCEGGIVYDITDDWISFYPPSRSRDRVFKEDARLLNRSDSVIVCSQRLYDLKLPTVGPDRLHLIPNGVDANHYSTVRDRSLPLPDIAKTWPSPVFGYTGTLHPDRVDVALIERLASTLEAGGIALVGPNYLSAEDQARLRATGRIFMTGPVPYREIPDYMRAFDVCIVPHRITPFTESLNPIKLWEYLAAGKPIVSTEVAGFRDYPSLVYLAKDADAFAAALTTALDEPIGRAQERIDEASHHSWSNRVDAIEDVLHDVESRRGLGASALSEVTRVS